MFDISLEQISFCYGENVVLNNFSLNIENGDFVAIVGPNGSGKSTMLKIIAGLLKPQSGKVSINGQSVRDACAAGTVGYVPQNYTKNSHGFPATVQEIVALGLISNKKANHGKDATRHIVDHMLKLVDIEKLRHRLVGELSGGQQQRVMVARALAGNPRLLLLDEPTSGVDFETSTKIYGLLGQLNKNLGITVVAVSHDIEKVTRWANKVACVNKGLCFYGPAEEFRETHATAPHLLYFTN
jgi:zinc transport system ATP-binding protein